MSNDYYVVSKVWLKKYTQKPVSNELKLNLLDYGRCVPGSNKRDIAKVLGIAIYDTAIPQMLVDDILEKTGYDICRHAVYDYSDNTHGCLHAITREGVVILAIYGHIL